MMMMMMMMMIMIMIMIIIIVIVIIIMFPHHILLQVAGTETNFIDIEEQHKDSSLNHTVCLKHTKTPQPYRLLEAHKDNSTILFA